MNELYVEKEIRAGAGMTDLTENGEMVMGNEREKDAQLYASRKAFQIAAEESGNLFFTYDIKSQSILVDEKTAQAFGVSTEQAGIPYEVAKTGIISEDTVDEYIRIHKAILDGAHHANGIVKLIQTDGTESVQELKLRLILDEQGASTGIAVGSYHDITHILKVRKDSAQIYRERIKMLMSGDKSRIHALYMDVSCDRLIAVVSENDIGDRELSDNCTLAEWLSRNIYPYVFYTEELEKIKEIMDCERLQQEFMDGKQTITYHCRYVQKGQFYFYKTSVNMIWNTDTEHLEAYIVWENDTLDSVDKVINHILYEEDYRTLMVIDLEREIMYLRFNHFEKSLLKQRRDLAYYEALEKFKEMRVHPKDHKKLERYMNLENIAENMKLTGHHSFTLHDIDGRAERYTFYWFDQKHHVTLLVIDDMTRELEKDALTGYPNRIGFHHLAERILAQGEEKLAILYMNISDFKAINDLVGYEEGDTIICEAIDNLQNSFLYPLVVARMEADRFVLLVKQENLHLDRLTQLLHSTYNNGRVKLDIYGRCGIYYIPEHCSLSISEMCDRAKLTKKFITNRYVQPYAIYNERMGQEYEKQSIAMLNLESAIHNHEFSVYYQPIYDAQTEKIVSAEALVRWESKEHGIIYPNFFIPALENSGHITKLDAFVNRSVHDFLAKRYQEHKKILPIAINLSRMDLMDKEIMSAIREDIRNTDLPKDIYRYEITESAYTEITDVGNLFLAELRENGGQILLDDFGSGLSSFNTVSDYGFDILKLDMGFVRKINQSEKVNHIISSMIDMAHRLKMRVVAEGVETKEHVDFLRKNHCDYLQGYYFSKPIPVEAFEKLLDTSL